MEERVAWISADISTITKAAVRPATTRLSRVRSFIGGFDVSSAQGLLVLRRRTHENHEASFMMIPFASAVPQHRMGRGSTPWAAIVY
jgi:hypothetical protein